MGAPPPPPPVPRPRVHIEPNIDWYCEYCTRANDMKVRSCHGCGAPKPRVIDKVSLRSMSLYPPTDIGSVFSTPDPSQAHATLVQRAPPHSPDDGWLKRKPPPFRPDLDLIENRYPEHESSLWENVMPTIVGVVTIAGIIATLAYALFGIP